MIANMLFYMFFIVFRILISWYIDIKMIFINYYLIWNDEENYYSSEIK